MSDPKQTSREAQKERLQKWREMARAYRRLFATEDGKAVLADLQNQFGWGKPSARVGMRNEEVWMAEGMKLPLFHIDHMITVNLDQPKQQESITQ